MLPKTTAVIEIQCSQLTQMMIMAQINSDPFSCDELERLIARDMGISCKLFKYLNSAFFPVPPRSLP